MSVPVKHHYLPQFYLSRWVSAGGVLFEYSRPYRDIVVRERLPSETGFEAGLYSIRGRSDPHQREEVELTFMQRLDDLASKALAELEQRRAKPNDAELVSNWSRFVMSLVYRNPARVEEMKERVRQTEPDPRVQQAYEAARTENDPATYEEFITQGGNLLNEELLGFLLRRIIDSKFIGERLNNMFWAIEDVQRGDHDLLVSDNPVVTSNGIGQPDGFLLVPIGPRTFFLATNDNPTQKHLLGENRAGRLASGLNNAVVRNAQVMVIASADNQRRFVEKRLVMPGQPPRERLTWQLP